MSRRFRLSLDSDPENEDAYIGNKENDDDDYVENESPCMTFYLCLPRTFCGMILCSFSICHEYESDEE